MYQQPPPVYSAYPPGTVPQPNVPQYGVQPGAYAPPPQAAYPAPAYPAAYPAPTPAMNMGQNVNVQVNTVAATVPAKPKPKSKYPSYISNSTRESCAVNCPFCHKDVFSSCEYVAGDAAWFWFFVLLCLGTGCCLFPLFMQDCHDCHHTCPECQREIAVSKPK